MYLHVVCSTYLYLYLLRVCASVCVCDLLAQQLLSFQPADRTVDEATYADKRDNAAKTRLRTHTQHKTLSAQR